jgi:hypothetical protein
MADKKVMKNGDFEIIVSIKKTPNRKRLRYNESKGRILGTISFYQIEIAAWLCRRNGVIKEVQLLFPSLDIINYGYRIGLAEKPGFLFSPKTMAAVEDMRRLRKLILKFEEQKFKSGKENHETKKAILILLRKLNKENLK